MFQKGQIGLVDKELMDLDQKESDLLLLAKENAEQLKRLLSSSHLVSQFLQAGEFTREMNELLLDCVKISKNGDLLVP